MATHSSVPAWRIPWMRRQCGVSPEARRGSQGASRAAPGMHLQRHQSCSKLRLSVRTSWLSFPFSRGIRLKQNLDRAFLRSQIPLAPLLQQPLAVTSSREHSWFPSTAPHRPWSPRVLIASQRSFETLITGPDSRTLIWKVPWSLSHSWENQRGINGLIPGEETTSKMSLVHSAYQGRLKDALSPPGLLPPFLLHVINFPFQPVLTQSSLTVEPTGW